MQISLYEWIQFIVLVLTVAGIGLAHLKNQSFITRSTAWTNIVAGASNIVAQIEATLQSDTASTTRAQLIEQGVTELRQVYAESLAAAKLPGGAIDSVLTLLLQRLGAKLPTSLAGLLGDVVTPVTAGGVVTGTKVVRATPSTFLRPVGLVRE